MAVFFIFMFSFILSTSFAAVQDFCVADYTAPSSPAGYSCKRPEKVTVDDFVYSGLGVAGNTSNITRDTITLASYNEVPALNGLGLSMARIDMAPGGVIPLHTHPGASEIFLLVKGKLIAAFISSDTNTVYNQTAIKSGDMFVIPKALLHGFVNIGGAKYNPVVAFASYSSENLHIQSVDNSLFNSTFSTELINRTTFIRTPEIRRLKARLSLVALTNKASISSRDQYRLSNKKAVTKDCSSSSNSFCHRCTLIYLIYLVVMEKV